MSNILILPLLVLGIIWLLPSAMTPLFASSSNNLTITGNGDTALMELKATNENGKTNKVSDFRMSADNVLFIEQNDKVTITDNVDFTRALVTDSNDNDKRIGVSSSGVIDFAGYAQGIYTLDVVVDDSRAYEAIIVIGEQDEQVVDREITRVNNKQITEIETDNNGGGNCDRISYPDPDVCIPPSPPDLNCPDIPYKNFQVTGEDPHGFDRDNDGIGCESVGGGGVRPPGNGNGNCDSSYPTVCIKSPPPNLNCGNIPHINFEVTGNDPHGFDRDNDGIGCESANGEDTPTPTPTPTPDPPTDDPTPDPGLPYCDLVPREYEGSCHDRKDYDESTGLTTCRDGSKVEDWRDCPDAGKHPDETLPQRTDCETGFVWYNGQCRIKTLFGGPTTTSTPTPTPSPESTLFGSPTSTPTPAPTPNALARGLLPTTPSPTLDNPCEAIPERDIPECKDLPAEIPLQPTPLQPTPETLFPTEEIEEIPNVPLEDTEEEEVEEEEPEEPEEEEQEEPEGPEESGGDDEASSGN